MPSLKRLLFLFLAVATLVSCGDSLMKKSKDEDVRLNQLTRCEPDTDSLANFLKEKIPKELGCLKENLELFVEVVRTDRPGNLSLKELKIYIKNNMKDIKPSVLDLLDVVFELNSLVFGDDNKYIEKKNISRLMELLIKVNDSLVEHHVLEFYKSKDKDKKEEVKEEKISYKEHNRRKAHVFKALSDISVEILKVSKVNNNELDLENILEKLKAFKDDQKPDVSSEEEPKPSVLDNLKDVIFVKKIFLGGSNKILTSKELHRLARMLPDIAKVSFDIANFKKIESTENEEEEIFETFSVGSRSLVKHLFYPKDSLEPLMSVDDILQAVRVFSDDKEVLKWLPYRDEFLLAKELLLDSHYSIFTAKEVYELFHDIININLDRGVFIYKTYRMNDDILDSGDMITIDLPFEIDFGEKQEEFSSQMNSIVQKNMFFKGRDFIPRYSRNIKRSALGIVELAIAQDLLKRVFKRKVPQLKRLTPIQVEAIEKEIRDLENTEGESASVREKRREKIKKLKTKIKVKKALLKQIDEKQIMGNAIVQGTLVSFFEDFEQILVAEDIVTEGRSANTAETITLMTSLFQAQSNGDSYLEVEEVAEFMISVLSGFSLAEIGNEYFVKTCKEGKRYKPSCFRKNFREFLNIEKEQVLVGDKLSGLRDYLDEKSQTDIDQFLKVTEGFTRSCTHFTNGDPVPYNKGELNLVMTGMLAIEQTMNRFDKNDNNILDEQEVDDAFVIYESAIKGLIPISFLKGRAKDFFLYLMKYKKVPDVQNITGLKSLWKAVKEGSHFALFMIKRAKRKRTTADRETIATVLKIVSEMSPESVSNPFPCHLLKN